MRQPESVNRSSKCLFLELSRSSALSQNFVFGSQLLIASPSCSGSTLSPRSPDTCHSRSARAESIVLGASGSGALTVCVLSAAIEQRSLLPALWRWRFPSHECFSSTYCLAAIAKRVFIPTVCSAVFRFCPSVALTTSLMDPRGSAISDASDGHRPDPTTPMQRVRKPKKILVDSGACNRNCEMRPALFSDYLPHCPSEGM